MDIGELLDGYQDKAGRTTILRKGVVVATTERAILFFDDESVTEFWVSRKMICDWRFVEDGTRQGLADRHLARNDEIELLIPKWLARKEGLI